MAKLLPEEILENLKKEEENESRGKLKIFLGYSAGVGKTYHMLDLAKELQKSGRDVVVGYVERHDRKETLDLLEGFEIIPPKQIQYKHIILQELDLEKALERKPELIIVDELAHTNSNGMEHHKRYEDIETLLQYGIDVYTTLNIQHIQSISSKVREITNIKVTEIVPDEILKKADNVELIDIEPSELLLRINNGKVYKQEKIQDAKNNFFTLENLIGLREIALQYMSNLVDRKNISISLKNEVLVCLSLGKDNIEVLEKAITLSGKLHLKCTMLYIPKMIYLTRKQKEYMKKQEKIIKNSNGKMIQAKTARILKEIQEYIKENDVTTLVISKKMIQNRIFLLHYLLDKIELDVYMI